MTLNALTNSDRSTDTKVNPSFAGVIKTYLVGVIYFYFFSDRGKQVVKLNKNEGGGDFCVAKYHVLDIKGLQDCPKRVFLVFISSNGFPYSLTERVCSSKFGLYNQIN